MFGVEPLVRSLADQVRDRLRGELLAGAHQAGAPLREEDLASRFGVSRHPIRKALQQLALEGLLVARPNRGMVVAAAAEHVEGLLTPMRVQLELYALARALPALDNDRRQQWDEILRRMSRACEDGDPAAILDQDAALHQHLLVVAGLDEMIPLWQAIYCRMRDYHRDGNAKLDNPRVIHFIHERLIASLFTKDLAQANADWRSHLENGAFNHRARAAFLRKRRKD